ncbi:hypothetical protein [Adhaeribacter aquaticus]|uniref:hypothetical protein n=1 Tax=Adhaeribacter aquaticus TaxID=299567 RepID=UPI00042290CE|nr:hypothetical protein [Adhaeribacter aquaticus]
MVNLTEKEIVGFSYKEVEEKLLYVRQLLRPENDIFKIETYFKYVYLLEQRKNLLSRSNRRMITENYN